MTDASATPVAAVASPNAGEMAGETADVLKEAEIEAAEIAPGHDGQAELVVRVRYPNGALGSVTLDARCAAKLLADCEAHSIEALAGQPWHRLMNVLT